MCASLLLVACVHGDNRGSDIGNDERVVTVGLLSPFHRIGGDLCGFGEVPAPNLDHRAVEIKEHQVAVLGAFDAAVTDTG